MSSKGPAAPIGQLEQAAVGSVHVEPQPFVAGHVGDVVQRIDRSGVGGPGVPDDQKRRQAGAAIGGNAPLDLVDLNTGSMVAGDFPDVAPGVPASPIEGQLMGVFPEGLG